MLSRPAHYLYDRDSPDPARRRAGGACAGADMPDTCLGDEELRAFLLGELPEGRSEAVARHLETCAACEAR